MIIEGTSSDFVVDYTVPAMPTPRCLHGNPWNACALCPDNRKHDAHGGHRSRERQERSK